MVKSGEEWEKVGISGESWGKVAKSWKKWGIFSLSIAFLAISDQYATFIF